MQLNIQMQQSLNSSMLGDSVLEESRQKELFSNTAMAQIIDKNTDKNDEKETENKKLTV